jgi:putative transposase
MAQASLPLTALSEAQRAQALQWYTIICPALEKERSQAQVARIRQLAPSTVQLWVKKYREKGLAAGLAHARRSDKGSSRHQPEQAIRLVEGLAQQNPPRLVASIHRQGTALANEEGWKPPGYERVRQIIKNLDPPLVTMAHRGVAANREEFDLLYQRESPRANAMWQADHTQLDVLLFDEVGTLAKPWLTAIEDDYSCMIVGYRLSFQKPTALTIALTLRQAICRKEDPRWPAYGIMKGNIHLIGTFNDTSRTCVSHKSPSDSHKRGDRDGTPESHHRARLSEAPLMSCLKTVPFLRH